MKKLLPIAALLVLAALVYQLLGAEPEPESIGPGVSAPKVEALSSAEDLPESPGEEDGRAEKSSASAPDSVETTTAGKASEAEQAPQPPEAELVTLSGRVELVGGGFARSARVHLVRGNGADVERGAVDCDEQGAFRIQSPHGRLFLYASAKNCARSEPLEVETTAGESRDGLLIELTPGVVLKGELLPSLPDREGRKVLASRVDRYEMNEATCDAQGRFEFKPLAPGSYRVLLDWREGGGPEKDWVVRYANRHEQRVELIPGETAHVLLGGEVPGQIVVSGEVTHLGEPAPGLLVYAFIEGDGQPQDIARTDEQGAYVIKLVFPGTVRFTIGESQLTQVAYEESIPDAAEHRLDFALPGGVVWGTVSDSKGQPIPGHSLMLVQADAPSGTRGFDKMRMTKSDGEGRFEFIRLRGGEYRLRSGGLVRHKAGAKYGTRILNGVVLEAEGDEAEVHVELAPAAALSGVVRSTSGEPISGAKIHAVDSAGWSMLIWGDVLSADDGSYRYPELDGGELTVWCEVDGDAGPKATVTLQPGEAQELDLVGPQ